MNAAQVRTRTCCFCLPVRFGVFVVTILGLAGGILLSYVGWSQTVRLQGVLPKANEIALYIASALWTLLAVLSLFGFVGAIIRNRTMISIFFMILVGHLIFSIISGAFALYNIFNVAGPDALQQCLATAASSAPGPDVSTAADCQQGFNIIRGVAVGVFILAWLLEIWACFIVNSYINQLTDEKEAVHWKSSDVEVGQIAGPRPLR